MARERYYRGWSKFHRYDAAPARFVAAIKAAKGRNLIDELLDPARLASAQGALPGSVPRSAPPFHTAAELASLWPLIAKGLLGYTSARSFTPAALYRALEGAGLPIVGNASDGKPGHIWQGRRQVYFWTVWPVPSLLLTDETFRAIMSESFDDKKG